MNESLFKIAITHGDYNGIGYEIILKALCDNKMTEFCTPIVYGLPKVVTFYKSLSPVQEISVQVIEKLEQINLKKNNLLSLAEQEVKVEPGKVSPEAGKMAEFALTAVCKDLKAKLLDAVVTAPVCLESIQSSSFKFNGHSPFFAQQFASQNAMMLMLCDKVRMAFVNSHLSADQLTPKLNAEIIVKKLKSLNQSLKSDFVCTNPKIAVLALNSAADNGVKFGKFEDEVLQPAIEQAFNDKVNAFGPFDADKFFENGLYTRYDAVLVMCREQGIRYFNNLSNGEGICFTAGLPFVHTAPEEGVSFDIAGQDGASGQSMRNAIYTAIDILRNRKEYAAYSRK